MWAGWPSGQRCQLLSVGTRVQFQPKSKFFFEELRVWNNSLLVILN